MTMTYPDAITLNAEGLATNCPRYDHEITRWVRSLSSSNGRESKETEKYRVHGDSCCRSQV